MADLERRRNGAGRGGPARGYSWQAFQPGHQLSVRHGAYAIVQLSGRAGEIRERLEQVVPFCSPADGPLIDLASGLMAQAERGLQVLEAAQAAEVAALERGEPVDEAGRQHLGRLSSDCRGWLNSAMRALDRLGCSPTSRAALGLDIALAQRTLSVVDLHAAAVVEGDAVEDTDELEAAS